MKGFLITDSLVVPVKDIAKLFPWKKIIDGNEVEGTGIALYPRESLEFIPQPFSEVKDLLIAALRIS